MVLQQNKLKFILCNAAYVLVVAKADHANGKTVAVPALISHISFLQFPFLFSRIKAQRVLLLNMSKL